jgi:hypothetical protein
VIASRINPKDPRIKTWDSRVPEIIAVAGKGDVAVSGSLSGEDGDLAAYGFVKTLASQAGKYSALLNSLRAGTSFDQAFSKAYGGSPLQVAAYWTPKPAKRGR